MAYSADSRNPYRILGLAMFETNRSAIKRAHGAKQKEAGSDGRGAAGAAGHQSNVNAQDNNYAKDVLLDETLRACWNQYVVLLLLRCCCALPFSIHINRH